MALNMDIDATSGAGPSAQTNPMPSTSKGLPSVVTTSLVQTTRLADGKKMINQYVMDAKVGSGQHGNVWRCYTNADYYSLGTLEEGIVRRTGAGDNEAGVGRALAMKIVKRDNPRARKERQMKIMRARAKEAANPNAGNSIGTLAKPRTSPPVVDGIHTAESEIRKEIAIMKKCRHPNVVRLYEVIDDRKNEMVFMVMEYLGGGEIKYTHPTTFAPILTIDQTRRIMRDAILGLEYLHWQGIIHRDIKPANLLWSEGHERVKIADFGTAHFSYAQRLAAAKASGYNMGEVVVDTEEDPLLLNDADLAKRAGSPAFLAPEIVWEYMEHPNVQGNVAPPVRPPVTKSIDIWALGVTLYCLLFGKTPFKYSWEETKRKERGVVAREHPCDGQEGEGGEGDEKQEEPEERFTEWMHYHWVCNKDWTAPETMGYDKIETGGRGGGGSNSHSSATQTSSKEGAIIMHLLDHFLQKDLDTRITLEEVKMNPWFLHDLPNPDYWLRMTAPNDDGPSGLSSGSFISGHPVNSYESANHHNNTPTHISTDDVSTTNDSGRNTPVPIASGSIIMNPIFTLSSSSGSSGMTIPTQTTEGSIAQQRETTTSTLTSYNSTSSGGSSNRNATPTHNRDSATAFGQDSITSLTDSLKNVEKINVTEKERDDAMSVVRFRWNRLARRSGTTRSRSGSRSGSASRPPSGIISGGVGIGVSKSMSVAGGEASDASSRAPTLPPTRLSVSTQGQLMVHTSHLTQTHQVQNRGSLSRLSHRITTFFRGAVPSRSRDSLHSQFVAGGSPSSSSPNPSASVSSPNVSSSSHIHVNASRDTNSRKSRLSGSLRDPSNNRNRDRDLATASEVGKGRWRDRTRSKGKGKAKDDGMDLRDRGPVTSEPNMRSRARRREARGEVRESQTAGNGRERERERRREKEKDGDKSKSRKKIDQLEAAVAGAAGVRKPERTKRKGKGDVGEQISRMSDAGARKTPVQEHSQDKGEGKLDDTPRPMSSPLPVSPSVPSTQSSWSNLPTPISPSPTTGGSGGSQSHASTSPVQRILSTLSLRSRSGWRSSVSLGQFNSHSRNHSASSDIVVGPAAVTAEVPRGTTTAPLRYGDSIAPARVYAALSEASGSGTNRPHSQSQPHTRAHSRFFVESSDDEDYDYDDEDRFSGNSGGVMQNSQFPPSGVDFEHDDLDVDPDADEFDDFEDDFGVSSSDDLELAASRVRVRRTSSWDHHPPELDGMGIIQSFSPERGLASISSAYGTASGSGSEVPSPTTPSSLLAFSAVADQTRTQFRFVKPVGEVKDDVEDDVEVGVREGRDTVDDEDLLIFSTGKKGKGKRSTS